VGGVLPRISIGTWGLKARLCLSSSCLQGQVRFGGGVLLFILHTHPGIKFGRSRTGEGSSGGRKRGVV
jgi:hypothetical protein